MALTSILLLLAAYLLLAWCWWWLVIIKPARATWREEAPLPLLSSIGLQFTLMMVFLSTALSIGDLLLTLILPVLPPIMWLFFLPEQVSAVAARNATALITGILVASALAAMAVAVRRSLVRYVLVPCAVAGAAVTLLLCEQRSAHRMETRAEALGADCLARHRFWTSLTFWGEEFQWNLHAIARIDGEWHGWSYREDDFYSIPERAPKDGNGLQADCLDQITR